MSTKVKFYFDEDMGIFHQDCGPWRSYQLYFAGNNLQEILEDMTISEIDQDGGELNCYGIDDAENEVQKAAYQIIEDTIGSVNNEKQKVL